MNRTLFAAVLALGSLSAGAAMAQAPAQDAPMQAHPHRMHNPHKQAVHMSRKLGLSSDQTSRLEPILAQRQQQAMAIRQNTALTPEQKHTQLRDLHRSTRQQLSGVLTPDQMQQWKSMRKQHGQPSQTPVPPTGA